MTNEMTEKKLTKLERENDQLKRRLLKLEIASGKKPRMRIKTKDSYYDMYRRYLNTRVGEYGVDPESQAGDAYAGYLRYIAKLRYLGEKVDRDYKAKTPLNKDEYEALVAIVDQILPPKRIVIPL